MQMLLPGGRVRVLVTGASGFVGRQTIGALARAGVEVHAHAQHAEKVDGAVVAYGGDLRAPGAAGALINRVRPDTVLHLAWNVEHGAFWTSRDNLDWTAATLLLARAALDAGVQRFVGVGTCFEYRWPDDGTCNEGTTEIAPATLYAVAKDAARRVLQELGDISFAWARLFYLYGPFEHEARLVASLAAKLPRGKTRRFRGGLRCAIFSIPRRWRCARSARSKRDYGRCEHCERRGSERRFHRRASWRDCGSLGSYSRRRAA